MAELQACRDQIAKLTAKLALAKNWESDPVPLSAMVAGTTKLPDVTSKLKQRRLLNALTGKVSACDWSPDNRHCASASQDGKVIIWNAYTSNKDHFISQASSWFMTCKYSPDGKILAVGGLDNALTIYKLPSQEEMENGFDQKIHAHLAKHLGYLGTCGFLNNEEVLSGSGDQSAILWDIETKTPKQTFTGHTGDCATLSVMPDSKDIFVTGSTDKTARLWDRRTKGICCVASFPGHEGAINKVKFFPTKNAFGTASDDSSCRMFDLRCFKQVNVYSDDNHDNAATALAFSASGRLVFAGHNDGSCYVWDTCTGKFVDELNGHSAMVSDACVSPDGKALCLASHDINLTVWA